MTRQQSSTLWCLLAMLIIAASGCTQTRTITIETIADPNYLFASPSALTLALGSVPASVDPAQPPAIADAKFDPLGLTLNQRIVRSDLEAAARSLGYEIVASLDDAAMVCYFTETQRERSYDSYERVPVTYSTIGFGWGRGHSRDFYSTTHSSVVVPVTRTERLGTIWLAATPTERANAPSSADRSPADVAVWIGSLTTDAADLQVNRVSHIRQLLSFWGRTARTEVEVPINP